MHNIWYGKDIEELHFSNLLTNFRYKSLHQGNGLGKKYNTAVESGIGANLLSFNIGGKEKKLLISESPPKNAVDLWLDEIIKNEITVFVTLTNQKTDHSTDELNDLDAIKLERYRNKQTVELHHIKNLQNNTTKYNITNQKMLENNQILEVWECQVNNKVLRQIKFKDLDDAVGISHMKHEDLVINFRTLMRTIIKYSPNLNVAFNCFMGVGRARFSAFLFVTLLGYLHNENVGKITDEIINNTVSYPYQYIEVNAKIIESINQFE